MSSQAAAAAAAAVSRYYIPLPLVQEYWNSLSKSSGIADQEGSGGAGGGECGYAIE